VGDDGTFIEAEAEGEAEAEVGCLSPALAGFAPVLKLFEKPR
jgi:hypothetical protein